MLDSENVDIPMVNPYQIYCDMDGVLVDFASGATIAINEEMKKVRDRMAEYKSLIPDQKNPDYKLFKLTSKLAIKGKGWNETYTWQDINKDSPTKIKAAEELMFFLISRDSGWWSNLNWAPGGRRLWSYIEKYNPIILTSGAGPKSEVGKREWCKRYLGIDGNRVIVTANKGIDTDNKIGILIDDREKPLNQFHGIKILHITGNAEKTISELENLGL
jgi:5'(3')-deoxyribonucleotidase